MYICYLDESGTPEGTGNTDHFVLLGLAIPAATWKVKDAQVTAIKAEYGLENAEVHTAWMVREFPEQKVVPNFASLDHDARRKAVLGVRSLNLARARTRATTRELTKNYRKTQAYVHLTRDERRACLDELADLVNSWQDCRIFADAHDKNHVTRADCFAVAFEQVVTRFNTFLTKATTALGLLVQDNNDTQAKRLTEAMRVFHRQGTLWAQITQVVETPMFVDSELTSMIQIADLCAYATRRFFENGETRYFDKIRPRFDRTPRNMLVGLRHFTAAYQCRCTVCIEHGRV
jgi:hypothetical protein